jgi:2-oxoisovalerate dehydrogenase E1 component
VIYAPYGCISRRIAVAFAGSEAAIVHYPGLNVVIPSTPDDAAGLLWSAMHAEDPTLV